MGIIRAYIIHNLLSSIILRSRLRCIYLHSVVRIGIIRFYGKAFLRLSSTLAFPRLYSNSKKANGTFDVGEVRSKSDGLRAELGEVVYCDTVMC